jgi:aryl-alcohol dehydrogenase-like predicted oxidoreductase
MLRHQENPFDDVVEYSPDCYHSISKTFMQHQLSESLKRLERTSLDCYLIHNPEYYILDAINKEMDKDAMLDVMYQRLYDAFVGLEEEVTKGRIGSYGISSNSFSKSHKDADFLPYEDLLTLAQNAADSVGNSKHSFTTLQLPINILEQEGLKCAAWAKKNGLRVLVNRPLNAEYKGQMFRLAEYDESKDYYHHLNELLDVCDNETLRPMFNLFEELDSNKHKFGWVGDFDQFLYGQILPHLKTVLENIDEQNRETMLNFIDMFFVEYRKMVAHECANNTKRQLKEKFMSCYSTLQECALRFLLEQKDIDTILVGMRKPTYVHEILSYKD